MRKLAGLALLAAAFGASAAPAAPPPRPKLVIAISVDQFADALFERYRAGFTGGLKRLADGARFTGYQSHAATETCPGHSTILTGMHPARTGIVANAWYDRRAGASVYCVAIAGVPDPHARGPQNLKVDTLGDWLKMAEPGARSIAVSGKDRAAIMMGGHHADAVYWWYDGEGFITSPYAAPAGAPESGPADAFDQELLSAWDTAKPALWDAVPPACAALQKPYSFGDFHYSGKVPPEQATLAPGASFASDKDFQDQLRASPLFDRITLDYAATLIDAPPDGVPLGRGPATDLLAISLSATDYVGHRYGNGGAEMCAQMASLDAALGAFFQKVDALGLPYVVVLTADHGGIDAAERAKDNGYPKALRIRWKELMAKLNVYLKDTLKLDYEPVNGDDPTNLILAVPGDAAARNAVRDAAVRWLTGQTGVIAAVRTREQIAAVPPPRGHPQALTLDQRLRESFDAQRSGDILVAYAEYATLGAPGPNGDVYIAGHGSPWDHDRQVPILFWWPGVIATAPKAGIETVDIAPTLAAMIGLAPPAADGACIELGQHCPR